MITYQAVFCDGPQSTQDRHGEEIPVWFVWMEGEIRDLDLGHDSDLDDDSERMFYSHQAAIDHARKLAGEHKIELVDESTEA